MAEEMGWQGYLHMRPENTWGIYDSGGTSLYVPYESFSLIAARQTRQAALHTGHRQRRHSKAFRNSIAGQLTCPLFGHHVGGQSLAQRMLEWATSADASLNLSSMSIEKYTPNEQKRYVGVRPNSMTLSGDAESGVVSVSFDLIGKREYVQNAPALDATYPQPVEFEFSNVHFYISNEDDAASASGSAGGSGPDGDEIEIDSFSLTINNNIQTKYQSGSRFPSRLPCGVRELQFQFSILKESAAYDILRRSTDTVQRSAKLELFGEHLGTASGNYTKVRILFDRLSFQNATDTDDLNTLVVQATDWIPLKPNNSGNDIDITYSTVSSLP